MNTRRLTITGVSSGAREHIESSKSDNNTTSHNNSNNNHNNKPSSGQGERPDGKSESERAGKNRNNSRFDEADHERSQ